MVDVGVMEVVVMVVVVGGGSSPINKKHALDIPTSNRFTWAVLGTKEEGWFNVRVFPPNSILQVSLLGIAVVVEEAANL